MELLTLERRATTIIAWITVEFETDELEDPESVLGADGDTKHIDGADHQIAIQTDISIASVKRIARSARAQNPH